MKTETKKTNHLFLYSFIKRFFNVLINTILNYFGYVILKITKGSAIINGKTVVWGDTTKIVKKSSCIYICENGKIKSRPLIYNSTDIVNVL